MINKRVVATWMLSLLEAGFFAAMPAAIGNAVSGGMTSLIPVAILSIVGLAIVVGRMCIDTRVYCSMLRDKAVSFASEDRDSARARAGRWSVTLRAVEKCGPMLLRGTADGVSGLVYAATISPAVCVMLLAASIPYVVASLWAADQLKKTGRRKNELAATEAAAYAGSSEDIRRYYHQQYLLDVEESDIEAKSFAVGMGVLYAARLAVLAMAIHTEVDSVTIVILSMYVERYMSSLDRLMIVVTQTSQALIASKA